MRAGTRFANACGERTTKPSRVMQGIPTKPWVRAGEVVDPYQLPGAMNAAPLVPKVLRLLSWYQTEELRLHELALVPGTFQPYSLLQEAVPGTKGRGHVTSLAQHVLAIFPYSHRYGTAL